MLVTSYEPCPLCLFASPREDWTMRIAQVAGPNRTRPFDTWLITGQAPGSGVRRVVA